MGKQTTFVRFMDGAVAVLLCLGVAVRVKYMERSPRDKPRKSNILVSSKTSEFEIEQNLGVHYTVQPLKKLKRIIFVLVGMQATLGTQIIGTK